MNALRSTCGLLGSSCSDLELNRDLDFVPAADQPCPFSIASLDPRLNDSEGYKGLEAEFPDLSDDLKPSGWALISEDLLPTPTPTPRRPAVLSLLACVFCGSDELPRKPTAFDLRSPLAMAVLTLALPAYERSCMAVEVGAGAGAGAGDGDEDGILSSTALRDRTKLFIARRDRFRSEAVVPGELGCEDGTEGLQRTKPRRVFSQVFLSSATT